MNKTTPIELNKVVQNGSLVYSWLGMLWTQLCEQPELVRGYAEALGINSAQLYLDFAETMKLLDRNAGPVFHRERWHMLQLSEDARNTGKAVAARMGGTPTPQVGPQTAEPFQVGAQVEIGGYVGISGVTTYPLPPGTKDILTTITDSIVRPGIVLLRGEDFYVEEETLVFVNGKDPFALGFPMASVDGVRRVALWASDMLVDKNFVYNQMGHVLGVRDASSEFYAAYLNGLWDLRNMGAPLALVRAGIAAVLDEPFILEPEETVDVIIDDAAGRQVVTDKHVYAVPSTSELRTSVVPGAKLTRGELLTQTVRVYDNLDPTRLSADSEYGARLRTDVDALYLPPGFFRAELKHGLGMSWDIVPITYAGADANGNPKLKFKLYGSDDDVEAFWQDFWNYCEAHGLPSTACFPGRLRATLPEVEDATWGTVSPVEYFLYNYLKANLFVVVIDGDKLSAAGRGAMHVLSMLKPALPAHVCLMVVERRTIPTDEYDTGDNAEDDVRPLHCKSLHEIAGVNEYSKLRLTYGDARPIVHLIPKCVGADDEN